MHSKLARVSIVTIIALLPLYVWTAGASVAFVRQKEGAVRVYR